MKPPQSPLRYSMLIQWSEDDASYLVTLPEWKGRVFSPVTHGATYAEAVRNGQLALEDLVFLAREHGEALPEPSVVAIVA